MIFKKDQNFSLCIGLNSNEFQCKCKNDHCRSSFIHEDLLESYEKLRIKIGRSLKINSGHRCSDHNKKVGGSSMSQHLVGKAIDIDTSQLSQDVVEKLAKDSGFTFVLKYQNFMHLDVR